jgi:hypothetical protein
MKRNLGKLILAGAIITGGLLASLPTKAGFCPDCGSYVTVGDKVVFYCGNNGNTNCMRPCQQQ